MERAGLTMAEAARRLARVGPNELSRRGRISVWSSIGLQLRDPLIVVLLAACALTLVTGDLADAAVIAFVVVVNTTVGVTQEVRADRAITALAQLSAPVVRVLRDGLETSVASADLVPGDVVLLGEGDVVPADCDLLEASTLLLDESALTGESVAVGKIAAVGETPGDVVSSGTVVVKGRAVAKVTATGPSSALGRIAALMDTRVQPTPLQRRLSELGRVLALVAVALSGVVLALGLARGEPLELMLVTAISLAVAAVPESLPAVVTFSLALGARRMVARNAVVRRLPAVETLGSVTVLATDKTGTLTEARMVVEELWTPQHSVAVSGEGYAPEGELVSGGAVLEAGDAPDVLELLRAGVLCNDAHAHATRSARRGVVGSRRPDGAGPPQRGREGRAVERRPRPRPPTDRRAALRQRDAADDHRPPGHPRRGGARPRRDQGLGGGAARRARSRWRGRRLELGAPACRRARRRGVPGAGPLGRGGLAG